jgi:hypothetical protein
MLHSTLARLPSASPSTSKSPAFVPVSLPPADEGDDEEPEALYGDPDVSMPALREVKPDVAPAAPAPPEPQLDIDAIVVKALNLWRRFPLDAKAIRVAELLGPNSCVATFERDLSVEEAEAIVANGADVVLPEPEPERPLVPLSGPPGPVLLWLRQRPLVAAVGIAGFGVALALVIGDREPGNTLPPASGPPPLATRREQQLLGTGARQRPSDVHRTP